MTGNDLALVRTPPDAVFIGFARALRAAGLPVTADRERVFLQAVVTVGAAVRTQVYWSGRATMTSSPADIERYDAVFTAWFSADTRTAAGRPADPLSIARQAPLGEEAGQGDSGLDEEIVRAAASSQEVLRHRDVGSLSSAERRELAHLFARLHPRSPQRRARRHARARTGRIDGPATLRDQLRRMGEPGRIRHRRTTTRPRRVVLLIDVSGSMSPYADSLMRLAHTFVQSAASASSTEV
ncbi:MAG: VWA domain-containing protein, partial [Terracoccus sp.]